MNPITKETITAIILLAGVVLFAYIIKLIWQLVFIRIARKTRTKLDLMVLQSIQKPVYFTIIIFGFFFVFKRTIDEIPLAKDLLLVKVGDGIFFIALVSIISYLAYAFIKVFCDWYLKEIAAKTKSKFDDQFIPLFSRIMKIVIVFIVLTVILSHFKINITGFLATAGVASLAIALAAQDSLANMFASFTLLIDRPFRIGDRVELSSGTHLLISYRFAGLIVLRTSSELMTNLIWRLKNNLKRKKSTFLSHSRMFILNGVDNFKKIV